MKDEKLVYIEDTNRAIRLFKGELDDQLDAYNNLRLQCDSENEKELIDKQLEVLNGLIDSFNRTIYNYVRDFDVPIEVVSNPTASIVLYVKSKEQDGMWNKLSDINLKMTECGVVDVLFHDEVIDGLKDDRLRGLQPIFIIQDDDKVLRAYNDIRGKIENNQFSVPTRLVEMISLITM